MTNYTPPQFLLDAYNCPYCKSYAEQMWYVPLNGAYKTGQFSHPFIFHEVVATRCRRCAGVSLWVNQGLIYPLGSIAPLPSSDMPEDVKAEFSEARLVFGASPKASAALLRLALQRLCKHLGEPGKEINTDIGSLVKKGLTVNIQKAFDTVRIIGNQSVHPGEIDINEKPEIALALFALVNMIVDEMITRPKELDALYASLPDSKLDGIEKRDGTTP